MFWEFLFFCSFSLFCGSFWKFQKEHQIWEQLKEKLAKLLLFHADSQTLVEVDNQHETAANKCFLTLKGVQASSQQCKQTNRFHCKLATSPRTWLTWFANFSIMDTMALPDCQVRLSHSIQTFKSTCTFCWLLCSWINNVDDFFSKIFKNVQCVIQIWVMLPQEQESKEKALNHASSFSCRSRNTGNGVLKERKMRKRGIP